MPRGSIEYGTACQDVPSPSGIPRNARRRSGRRATRAVGDALIWISDRAGLRMVGERMLVLPSGEAGIGKSRLTAELLERLAAEPHTRLRYLCSPQHTDSALYPVIGQIECAAGTTARKRSSTSSTRCWRRSRPQRRTPRFLPRCCRSPRKPIRGDRREPTGATCTSLH
jgi:hypothetical protein